MGILNYFEAISAILGISATLWLLSFLFYRKFYISIDIQNNSLPNQVYLKYRPHVHLYPTQGSCHIDSLYSASQNELSDFFRELPFEQALFLLKTMNKTKRQHLLEVLALECHVSKKLKSLLAEKQSNQ